MTLRMNMLAILLPMIALIAYFSFHELSLLYDQKSKLEANLFQTIQSEVINDAIHELQKERGFSAGFTASKGSNFSAELTSQRASTDAALALLQTKFYAVQNDLPGTAISARDQLTELSSIRSQITDFDLSVADLAGWYTSLINDFLDAASFSNEITGAGGLPMLIEARIHINLAKEMAGLERATGAVGLGSGAFGPELHQRFLELGTSQGAMLESAAQVLHRPDYLNQILAQARAKGIETYRKAIIATAYDQSTPQFSGAQWFATSTAWIDLLRETELALSEEIHTLSESHLAKTSAELTRLALIVGIVVLGTVIFSVTIFERMISKFRVLIDIMARFKQGDFDVHVPFIEGRAEINVMADSIYRFKQETLAMRAGNQKSKEEDEAAWQSKAEAAVGMVSEGLQALAAANLSLQFEEPLSEEYDSLREDFNTSTARLRSVLMELATAVHGMSNRAERMASSSEELAQRTTRQGETIGATANGVDQVAKSVQADLEQLASANASAREARAKADHSGEIVTQAVEAMDRIAKSSEQIGQIIAMIEEISFQTNLLALNARVEAARAGESGRGFAVVAEEVRDLAHRSSQAANNIKSLISESGREVDEGVQLVHSAGKTLEGIIDSVKLVNAALHTVTGSAERQASDLDEVNQSMQVLRELTEANTSMVDASRSMSGDMATTSQRLSSMLSDFEFGAAEVQSPPSQAA